jgi:predicted amidophosphoribosyltransferase
MKNDNDMLIARIKGVKPQPGTPETEADPRNPNLPPCPNCDAATERWWSYCAMCGYHIAGGNLVSGVAPTKEG